MTETIYYPKVTRLRPPEPYRPRWKRNGIVVATLGAFILLMVDAIYDGPLKRYYTKPPVIAQYALPNGETLRVHGVLHDENDSLRIRSKPVNNELKFGQSLVISCVNQQSGRSSDWSWFKHIEVEDKYGSLIQGQMVTVITVSEDGKWKVHRTIAESKLENYRELYCIVHFPKVESIKPCEFLAIDLNDEVVARIGSPFPPDQPGAGFYDRSHDLQAKNGPWTVELAQITSMWYADGQYPYSNQFNPPEFHCEYEGNLLEKENVSQIETEFSDALGNPATLWFQPHNQPLWRYRMKVARLDYLTSKQAKELRPLGRVSDLTASSKLSISDDQLLSKSVLFVPVGKHATTSQALAEKEIELRSLNFGYETQRLTCMSCSRVGGSRGRKSVAKFTLLRNEELLKLTLTTKPNEPAKLEFDAKRPLVMLELAEPLQECLINVFAFDQFNRALQVDSVPNGLSRLPMFVVETESDTLHLDLFYSIEPMVPIDFYMVPPTKNLALPLDSGSTWMRMTGTKDGWNVDRQFYPKE